MATLHLGTEDYDTNGTNGKVGIGTTSPSEKCEIYDSSDATILKLTCRNSSQITAVDGDANRSGSSRTILGLRGFWDGNHVGEISVKSGDDSSNKDDGYLAFYTAEGGSLSERMRIEQNGYVGIGTTSPGEKLEVSGTGETIIKCINTDNGFASFDGSAARTASNTSIMALRGFWKDGGSEINVAEILLKTGDDTTNKDDGDIVFNVAQGGSLGEAMRIDQNKNVGIGTNNPKTRLHSTGDTILGVSNSAESSGNIGNGQVNIWVDQSSHDLKFQVKYSNGTVKSGSVALS